VPGAVLGERQGEGRDESEKHPDHAPDTGDDDGLPESELPSHPGRRPKRGEHGIIALAVGAGKPDRDCRRRQRDERG